LFAVPIDVRDGAKSTTDKSLFYFLNVSLKNTVIRLPADKICGTAVQLFDGSGHCVVRAIWSRRPDE
jgi:hypothetical protein